MDFDLSKENIQPLRGGRNATQLGVALQAQSSQEYQLELIQQKEEFENVIRNYAGDDPLENWYHYISWVEQSFPKHGHEGNLIPLLECCLQKFEDDKRFVDDRRLCKLWVKYNDLQQNPIELYHMLHAKGRCKGCADLYKAWAFYYEAGGNFQQADRVFKLGMQALAQPYEELLVAHQNMVFAAGQQLISGVDERRLEEQRQALTCLKTYKPGRVGSVRTSSASSYTLPGNAHAGKSNVAIPIYEDYGEGSGGAEAAPVSVLSVAKRSDAPKENTFKPGVWTVPVRTTLPAHHRGLTFTVHEDGVADTLDIKNSPDFFPVTHEDFSDFNIPLYYPDPEGPHLIRMYPKAQVYAEANKEHSLEEVRARKYLRRPMNSLNVPHCETQQAVQSILAETPERMLHPFVAHLRTEQTVGKQGYNSPHYQNEYVTHVAAHEAQVLFDTIENDYGNRKNVFGQSHSSFAQPSFHGQPLQNVQQDLSQSVHAVPSHSHIDAAQQFYRDFPAEGKSWSQLSPFPASTYQVPVLTHALTTPSLMAMASPNHPDNASPNHQLMTSPNHQLMASPNHQLIASPNHAVFVSPNSHSDSGDFGDEKHSINMLWRSKVESSLQDTLPPVQEKRRPNFVILEESNNVVQIHPQPKGSAMKTPFKHLTDEDLAETGSRGGLDIAAAAQPIDGAKNLLVGSEESNSSFCDDVPDFGFELNTQTFNFNLNVMQVSTPQTKMFDNVPQDIEEAKNTKKQLFSEPEKALSVIYEETKSSGSSSSSISSGLKLTFQMSKKNVAPTIAEEQNSYDFNLAQNMKANAALRSSLLGEFMECESQQSSPVTEVPPPIPVAQPSVTAPLVPAPSDPFKPALIKTLLTKINFPGQHTYGYCKMLTTPRLNVRKEVVCIGDDKYYVEKILGKGSYGSVYKAFNGQNQAVALKMQKPPNKWEFYICREVQARLANHPLKDRFMDVCIGYFNDQASILVSDFNPIGSLLDVANLVKQKQPKKKESLCLYICIEMLRIISALHTVQIIHADIKPDNFLVQLRDNSTITLQLIDFGCSIDMAMFPPGTSFQRTVTTEDFICCEMRDGRRWNYHTDLFCVAATAHVLLFEKYIQMQKMENYWCITQKFPRYMKYECWNIFFHTLLNQHGTVNLDHLIVTLTNSLNGKGDLNEEIRFLVNLLKGR